MTFNPCILIPIYNHETLIAATLKTLESINLPCLMIDDGSSEACKSVLADLANLYTWLDVIHLEKNSGKGAASMRGFNEAHQRGYTHALQVDADGQHCAADIPKLLDAAKQHPGALITGQPIYDQDIPKGRLYGRYLTHIWVWINTLSLQIKDSMLGFRVYPLQPTLNAMQRYHIGHRMEFDTEIMVKMFWLGTPVINIPTPVQYPENGVSHFDVLHDNIRISKMHTRLFFGMLLRFPWILYKRYKPWGTSE